MECTRAWSAAAINAISVQTLRCEARVQACCPIASCSLCLTLRCPSSPHWIARSHCSRRTWTERRGLAAGAVVWFPSQLPPLLTIGAVRDRIPAVRRCILLLFAASKRDEGRMDRSDDCRTDTRVCTRLTDTDREQSLTLCLRLYFCRRPHVTALAAASLTTRHGPNLRCQQS